MKKLSRDQLAWIIAGPLFLGGSSIYFLLATNVPNFIVGEYLALSLSLWAITWWISNQRIGRLGLMLSLPCLVAGLISARLVPWGLLPFPIGLAGEAVSFLTGIAGFFYVFVYDMPKMISQRKVNSIVRRADRILSVGILLVIVASGIDFSFGAFRVLRGSVLLGATISVTLALGVILVASGVIVARRNYSD